MVARDRAELDASPAFLIASVFAEIGVARGVQRLEGDFALAALDTTTGQCWLVRDRSGAAPLYWTAAPDGGLRFSTRPGGLDTPLTLDPLAVARFLNHGFVPAPHTLWRDVHALPAGALLQPDRQLLRGAALAANPHGFDGTRVRWDRSAEFGAELAIQQRLPGSSTEVQPGTLLLSAGLYSTVLLRAALARQPDGWLALSARTQDEDPSLLARSARIEHQLVDVSANDVPALLDDALMGGLFPGDPVQLLHLALLRQARGVVLSGVGGPQVFGTDPLYARLRRSRHVPGLLQRLTGEGGDPLRRLLTWQSTDGVDPAELDNVDCPTDDALAAGLWLDRTRLVPEGLLPPLWLAGELSGHTVRSPFMDAQLIKVAAQVPLGHLHTSGPGGLFARAFAERLGGRWEEPHRPLAVPLRAWLQALGPTRKALATALEGLVQAADIPDGIPDSPAAQLRLWRMVALARSRA